MGLEEQKEEREVLDSIFPDEITGIPTTIASGCRVARLCSPSMARTLRTGTQKSECSAGCILPARPMGES
jgi:hypothetical protein